MRSAAFGLGWNPRSHRRAGWPWNAQICLVRVVRGYEQGKPHPPDSRRWNRLQTDHYL